MDLLGHFTPPRPQPRTWARNLAAAALCALLAGCSTAPPAPLLRTLDEHTASTVTTARTPLVYFAEAPDLAVNARDYVSVWVVEVKENAVRRLYLACELWSTIDRTRVPDTPPLPAPAQVTLRIDEAAVPLRVAGSEPRLAGLRHWPFPEPPHAGGRSVYLRVSKEQLHWLAASRSAATLDVAAADGATRSFALWRDERMALREFLAALP